MASRLLHIALLSFSAIFILSFLGVALLSMGNGMPLEWMEGQMMAQAQRAAGGQALYVAPSVGYVPLIYPPLYFYVVGFLSLFAGLHFWVGRLVSILAVVVCAGLLGAWAGKQDQKRSTALITVGLFFATYALSGRWFDLVRVDSLFMLLAFAGLYVLQECAGLRSAVVAGLLFAAAFFTKQTLLLMAGPALLAALWVAPKRGMVALGVFAVAAGAGVALWEHASGGWFGFYVLRLPAGHGLFDDYALRFGLMMAPTLILLVVAFTGLWVRARTQRRIALQQGAVLAGCILASGVSAVHMGAYLNVLMPMYAGLALASGWALSGVPVLRPVLAVQFALLLYNPVPLVPGTAVEKANGQFLEEVAQLQGKVFIPEYPFLPQEGAEYFGMGGYDILRAHLSGADAQAQAQLQQDLHAAFDQRRYSAVITGCIFNPSYLGDSYRFVRHMTETAFVAGSIAGCNDLYVLAP